MTRIATQRMTRIGHTIQRPPPPRQGDLAAGAARSAMVGDSSPYSADSTPLPKPATLDLRTTTPPLAPGQPGASVLPVTLVLHCAAKSGRTGCFRAEHATPTRILVTFSHIRRTYGSRPVMARSPNVIVTYRYATRKVPVQRHDRQTRIVPGNRPVGGEPVPDQPVRSVNKLR